MKKIFLFFTLLLFCVPIISNAKPLYGTYYLEYDPNIIITVVKLDSGEDFAAIFFNKTIIAYAFLTIKNKTLPILETIGGSGDLGTTGKGYLHDASSYQFICTLKLFRKSETDLDLIPGQNLYVPEIYQITLHNNAGDIFYKNNLIPLPE